MSRHYPPLGVDGERAMRLARQRARLLRRGRSGSVDLLVALGYIPATKQLLAGLEADPPRVRAVIRAMASDDRLAPDDVAAVEVVRRAAPIALAAEITEIDPLSLLSGMMATTRSLARQVLLELGVTERDLEGVVALCRAGRWT